MPKAPGAAADAGNGVAVELEQIAAGHFVQKFNEVWKQAVFSAELDEILIRSSQIKSIFFHLPTLRASPMCP